MPAAAAVTSNAPSPSTAAAANPVSAAVPGSWRPTRSTDGPRYCAQAVKGKEAPPDAKNVRRGRRRDAHARTRHGEGPARRLPLAVRRRRGRVRRQVEEAAHAPAQLLPLRLRGE